MQHPIKQIRTMEIKCLSKHLIYCIIAILMCNSVYAASQGKIGIQSTATVEISVIIHQSLSAISPNEILLSNTIQNNLITSKPFCIANNGYKKNMNVSYNLIVDRLESLNDDLDRLPFNIFLEDKNNKRLLSSGMTIAKQSNLKKNEDIYSDCVEAGTQLSIENNNSSKNTPQPNTAGLLLLLVSPH